MKDFQTVSTYCLDKNPTLDPELILRETPFRIPDRLPRDWARTPRPTPNGLRHPSFLNLEQLAESYRGAYTVIAEIKKRQFRNPAMRKLTFKERLPGISEEQASRYCSMKASEAARDYVAHKYKLPVKGDALKCYLRHAHNPKVQDADIREIEQRTGSLPKTVSLLLEGQPPPSLTA